MRAKPVRLHGATMHTHCRHLGIESHFIQFQQFYRVQFEHLRKICPGSGLWGGFSHRGLLLCNCLLPQLLPFGLPKNRPRSTTSPKVATHYRSGFAFHIRTKFFPVPSVCVPSWPPPFCYLQVAKQIAHRVKIILAVLPGLGGHGPQFWAAPHREPFTPFYNSVAPFFPLLKRVKLLVSISTIKGYQSSINRWKGSIFNRG